MNAEIIAFALIAYSAVVILVKRSVYRTPDHPRLSDQRIRERDTWAITLSPDLFWSTHFKARIERHHFDSEKILKHFVQDNNVMNFWLSVIILFVVFSLAAPRVPDINQGLAAFVIMRMISRSIEIAYAFGRDVLDGKSNSTGLEPLERIRLAVVSYAEIFFYSAAAYVFIFQADLWHAIYLSLSIGTLTNIASAFPKSHCIQPYHLLCFFQVLTTMSLILLSLTSYLSRR